jgi:glycosyltransferase involved in cell wall biosynthesis
MPKRGGMLREMLLSVDGQSLAPDRHLIDISVGPVVPKLNGMLSLVDDGWVVQVDDDDLLYPNHVEVLAANLRADVVWTWCDVVGRDWSPNAEYQPYVLQVHNYIPANCAIRAEAIKALGGHRAVPLPDWHDWDLLRRLERAGASFLCVPQVTWQYRFHGGNSSA